MRTSLSRAVSLATLTAAGVAAAFAATSLSATRASARGNDAHGTPVVVEREVLQEKLGRANQLLSEAIGRIEKKDRALAQTLRAARSEVDDVRGAVAAAPESRVVEESQRMAAGMVGQMFDTTNRAIEADRNGRHPPPPPHVIVVREQAPPPPPPPSPPKPLRGPAIDDGTFRALLGAIGAEAFSPDQLRVLGEAVPRHWFTVAQTREVIGKFSFSNDQLDAVRLVRPRILDRENEFQLYGAFTFSNDKEELKKILAQ